MAGGQECLRVPGCEVMARVALHQMLHRCVWDFPEILGMHKGLLLPRDPQGNGRGLQDAEGLGRRPTPQSCFPLWPPFIPTADLLLPFQDHKVRPPLQPCLSRWHQQAESQRRLLPGQQTGVHHHQRRDQDRSDRVSAGASAVCPGSCAGGVGAAASPA